MIQRVTFSVFVDSLNSNGFSYEALSRLFDYYESLEEDLGAQITFDPVAIRCDWAEYSSIEDALSDYEHACVDVEELKKSTEVLELSGTSRVLVRNF